MIGCVFAFAASGMPMRAPVGSFKPQAIVAAAAVCTGGRLEDETGTAVRVTCCCHTGTEIACKDEKNCVNNRGICLAHDFGSCHFPSLTAKPPPLSDAPKQ